MLPKPPPPPPRHMTTTKQSKPRFTTKLVNGYPLPMASEYVPAWVAVLRECGYPLIVVVLDFESYFDEEYGLTKLSTPEYVMDKRWEVTGLAALEMDGQAPFAEYQNKAMWYQGESKVASHLAYLQYLYGPNLERCTVVMQNASFDASVLALRYGIWPKYLVDTKSLALAWNTRAKNDLGSQTVRWGLPLKSKEETKSFLGATFKRGRYHKPSGRGKKRKPPEPRLIMSPEQASALGNYAENDVLREWELFTILLPRLSNPAAELWLQHHTLELCTKPTLLCDADAGAQLASGMDREIDHVLAPTKLTREQISGDLSFEWALSERLRALGENPQAYMKVGKRGMMLALAKGDKERAILASHPDEEVRNLIAARGALDSWPLHIKRVQRMMAMALAWGGLMPVPVQYWGAHTGRFAGCWAINLQNLPKRGHPLVLAIRELLVAPDGSILVIVDLAAIEARVLAWIAGQADLIQKFANNEEIYCGFAAKVLGWPVRKPIKEGKPGYIKAIEDRHTWARNNIGKVGILGCGYGMGAKEPGTEADPKPNYYFAGAGLDLAMAERIVGVYRETNTAITGFWRAIEKAFVYTAKYKRPCEMSHGLRFDSTPEIDVVITLPNGRELHYHKVRLTEGRFNDRAAVWHEIEHRWDFLWGGTLTENVVQAMSRDILVEACHRLEDAGHHTAHHVHDELILVVKEDQGKNVLKLAEAELSKTPTWAPGLPLGAEGKVTNRYGNH